MTVNFANAGAMELDVIRTMGVSVKEGDNPIGYFGTGLKYAIATLLRTGHVLKLITGDEVLVFSTREKEIRGKKFQFVMMNDEQLGFTTDLGRDWEVWQAYRELYSNCIDEGGTITNNPQEADTVFSVNGPEIDDVHGDRGKIFLQGDPWIVLGGIEVHRGSIQYLFYRGVRVHKLPKKSRFTYNFTTNMKLTEDRTLASMYDANYKLNTRLPRANDPEFCAKLIEPKQKGYEGDLDLSEAYEPSEEFLDAIAARGDDENIKPGLRAMLKKARKEHEIFEKFTPEGNDIAIIREACEMLLPLNCIVRPEELVFVESLGENVYASADGMTMRFSRQCLAQGRDFMVITIYEEWIHNRMGFADCTRGMQQFLFDKILELIKR